MGKFFVFALLLATEASGKILRNEATRLSRESYSFKEACEYMGHRETLMVNPQGPAHLDCMGSVISATEFCVKKVHDLGSPTLEEAPTRAVTRGLVEAELKIVTCEKAAQVDVSLACDEKDGPLYCQSGSHGCGELKKIFAFEMDVEHKSIIQGATGRQLNCYFSFKAPVSDDAPKNLLSPFGDMPAL